MLFQKGRVFHENVEITAQSLQKELTFEGLPMVTLEMTLPVLSAAQPHAARINAYYQKVGKAILKDAHKRLLPMAVAQYRLDVQNSAPLKPFAIKMSFATVWNQAGYLSFYMERQERAGGGNVFAIGYADIWNLRTGRPVPIDQWLTAVRKPKKELTRAVSRMAAEQAERKAFPYYGNLRRRVRAHFKAGQTCLTPEGVRVFYQQATLSPPAAGIVSFTVPYETLAVDPPANSPGGKLRRPVWQGVVEAKKRWYNTKTIY